MSLNLYTRLVQADLDHARRFAWESVRGQLFLAYEMALDRATLAVTQDGK